MTAIDNANTIADEIEAGTYYGSIVATPRTCWCSWENDFFRFVIILFSPTPSTTISRDDMNDMISVFDTRFGVRLSYIQGIGVLAVETFYSETGERNIRAMIYRDDQSNSVIDR